MKQDLSTCFWLFWNSLCTPGCPQKWQKSACLCLPKLYAPSPPLRNELCAWTCSMVQFTVSSMSQVFLVCSMQILQLLQSNQKKKPKVSHVSESTIVTHRKVFSEHIIYYFKLPVLLYIFLMRHDKYRTFTTLHITRFQFFSICIRHLIPMLRLSISFSHYKIYSF